MPKKDMDYSKMVVYKICCKDLNITDIYVGHTTNLVKRRYKHKSDCCNEKGKTYDTKIYKFIRDNGGWENWEVIEIEKCPCLDFEEACKIERNYIEKLNASLNMVIPTRTTTEYYYDNKEKRLENHKKWVNQNLERVKSYNLQYREQNKERILERDRNSSKTYRENNKEKVNEATAKYYQNNKNKLSEKVRCECGCCVSFSSLTRHKKCKKHLDLTNKIIF